jgi:hypothetical protein
MNILLFGATGMVGDGVLRWLIVSPKVNRVVAVSRKPLSVQHPKLETVIEPDMFRLQHLDALRDFGACFFCLGASSVGMSPEDYRRLTYDLTVAVARQFLPEIRAWYSNTFPVRVRMRILGRNGRASKPRRRRRYSRLGSATPTLCGPVLSSQCAAPPAACDRCARCTP